MIGTSKLAAASSIETHESSVQSSHTAHNSKVALLRRRPCTKPCIPRLAHFMQ